MIKDTLIQKKNLALGNLAKLVFWSILSQRIEVLQNCSVSLARENMRELRKLSLENYTNSLVKEDLFYTNFTNMTFQKIPIPHLTHT
jgi:hypothetical protein